jgi:hypothetical protein
MKKTIRQRNEPGLKSEYDFTDAVRGKYARRYQPGSNVVVLEPDVAKAFPNQEKLNRSLRALAGIVELQTN